MISCLKDSNILWLGSPQTNWPLNIIQLTWHHILNTNLEVQRQAYNTAVLEWHPQFLSSLHMLHWYQPQRKLLMMSHCQPFSHLQVKIHVITINSRDLSCNWRKYSQRFFFTTLLAGSLANEEYGSKYNISQWKSQTGRRFFFLSVAIWKEGKKKTKLASP